MPQHKETIKLLNLHQEIIPPPLTPLEGYSIIIEKPNTPTIVSNEKQLAFDPLDPQKRFSTLSNELTPTALTELIQLDMVESLATHIAEIQGLSVIPYTQYICKNAIASIKIINKSEQPLKNRENSNPNKQIAVVNFLSSMLQSSLSKHPDDQRAEATRRAFSETIEPFAVKMPIGSRLVFFSPPGGDSEYKYGFMYILEKSFNSLLNLEELSGFAIKLDLKIKEYQELLNFNWLKRLHPIKLENSTDISIIGQALSFSPREFKNLGSLVYFLLSTIRKNGNGGININNTLIKDMVSWFKIQLTRYQKLKDQIKTNSLAVKYMDNINYSNGSSYLKALQEESIRVSNPSIWFELIRMASIFGKAQVNLGCGVIEINGKGFTDPVESSIRGTEISKKCKHCGSGLKVVCGVCNACAKIYY